jgi:hypothetical protein
MKRVCCWLAALVVLSGCALPSEHVLFVTKSSLGLDIDATPASASIAYDRTEGYLGPRFENGSAPPVVAKISSNGAIFFGRDVRQYYATGTAANLLSGDSQNRTSDPELRGEPRPMFFGTTTTLGIKLGFTANVPDSFIFGYRRKEASLIPTGMRADQTRTYPSVIGVFASDTEAKTQGDAKFGLTQFFATGTSAEALARDPSLGTEFKRFATDAVEVFKDNDRAQQKIALGLVECFTKIPDAKVDAAVEHAKKLELLFDEKTYADIKKNLSTDNRRARWEYVAAVTTIDGGSTERTGRLAGHREFVCDLSK